MTDSIRTHTDTDTPLSPLTMAVEGVERLKPFLNETVLVSVCRFSSGNSSVPYSEEVDEVIGELVVSKLDRTHFRIMDGVREVAQIQWVYKVGEGFYDRIHIEGWLNGYGQSMSLWGQWVVSK